MHENEAKSSILSTAHHYHSGSRPGSILSAQPRFGTLALYIKLSITKKILILLGDPLSVRTRRFTLKAKIDINPI